jgi:hypothetical protein
MIISMKQICIILFLLNLSVQLEAQKLKQIGVGLNATYHSNNTFRNKNSYVKGVPTLGYGASVLYQQYLTNFIGFQTSLNYVTHHKTFQIDFALKDFAEEYSSRPNYKFRYTIPKYRNLDLAIGIFYETKLYHTVSLIFSADLTANYEVMWAKDISYRSYYENPDPVIDSSQFFTIYGTHGVSKRPRSLKDYLLLLTPQYRISSTLDYHIHDNLKIYSSISYERIVPFRDGENGLFPKSFDFLNENLTLIENPDYMNKFNMFRFQIGFKYRINKNQDSY